MPFPAGFPICIACWVGFLSHPSRSSNYMELVWFHNSPRVSDRTRIWSAMVSWLVLQTMAKQNRKLKSAKLVLGLDHESSCHGGAHVCRRHIGHWYYPPDGMACHLPGAFVGGRFS